ncbi:hemagglutinin repeat-containing protein [Paraburkholderia acidicola]
MLVAVEETAAGSGKANQGETTVGHSRPNSRRTIARLALRHAAFGALMLAGVIPVTTPVAHAQIVPGGAHAPSVVQTQNGLPQVNVNRPSGAGVSMNTYGQFDVQKPGAILNNSPTIVNTQQAGYINGNPNFQPGQSASIIVNQVNSNNPSQLRGYVEVAGRRAEVIIANSSGLVVDGGGFINTSRAILTTGSPLIGANGNLTGFNVTGGQVTVQGAGLNATNTDQVDLIARAVQANAAIYANTLNVVAGTNQVKHDTLAATPIAGSGAAPGVSIDVSQLGGMYANRITLVGTENGVGVSNAGVIAAQAGDLTLTTQGKLVLTGKTNASGNLSVSAAGGVDNSGTTYGQQNVSVSTSGALTNSGTLAAQQNTTLNAGSVASTGTLGGGINADGSIAKSGDLNVTSSGALSATGHNAAGGSATLTGAALNLASSQTSANGNVTLLASAGDLTLAGATTTAGGTLSAQAHGTLTNDSGVLSSSGAQTIAAGALSNQGGQFVSQSTLNVNTGGTVNNRQGIIQAAGNETINAASLDNTAGRVVSLGTGAPGTLDITTSGALVNAAGTTGAGTTGGVIGSNGALNVSAGSISNQAQINATGNAIVRAQSLDNHAGSIVAGGSLGTTIGGALNNQSGTLSGSATTVSAASVDDTNGTIEGDQLALSATGNLVNRGGHITQYSNTDQRVSAGGTLDNTGGTITSNATNLTVSAQSLTNDSGSIQHAGTGTLDVGTTGTVSNTGGKVVTNGALKVTGGAVSNQGQMSAKGNATVTAQSLDNHAGSIAAAGNLNATVTGALGNQSGTLSGAIATVSASSVDDTNGTIEGDQLVLSTTGNLANRGGHIQQFGNVDQTVSAGGTIDNTGGTIATNATNLTVSAQAITNDSGSIQHAGTGSLAVTTPGALSNVGGQIATNGALTSKSASLDNTKGTVSAQGVAQVNATTGLTNHGGTLYGKTGLTATTQGALDNSSGSTQTGGNLSVTAGGALSNTNGTVSANGAHSTMAVSGSSIDNTSGKLASSGDGVTTITATTGITNTGGTMGGNGDVTLNAQTLANNANANLVAAGAANLNVTSNINNAGGTIYGGTALNLNQPGATVTNDGGKLEGGQDVSMQVASLSNAGGAINANRDITVSGAASGDGGMTAGRNLSLNVAGDYTNGAANNLHADGNLSVSATGTLTNSGTLAATGALTASGANVINAAGADINSASTTVNAAGTLTNAGRIEGNSVTTNSATLANTGTVIGNTVQVNATDVQNSGAAAAIAAAQNLAIYASNSVTNQDGALIYSGGNLQIAKDGTRDSSGMLADQTGTLTNSAASIQAVGDIDIAAHTVNNLRTGVVTQAGTPQTTGSTTLTFWTAGIPVGDLGDYQSQTYPQWKFNAGAIGAASVGTLAKPLTVTLTASQVTNLNATTKTFSLTTPLTDTYTDADSPTTEQCNNTCFQVRTPQTRTITNNATQYYNSITDNGNGTYSITFYPDYNPNTNINPTQVKVRTDLGSDNHDYVEMSRTSTTTTTTDQLLNAGTQAVIQAQGAIRINADGGSVNNQSSTMTAGGDLVRRANGGSVNDTGTVLQQAVTSDSQSTYYWHQKTGSSTDTKVVDDGITQSESTVTALPALATPNGSVQTTAQDINITSVNRLGQTVTGSGVTGGDATGTQLGGVNGQTAGVNTATGVGGLTVRPQTLGGVSGGVPNLKLPVNGLYTYQTAPGTTYLVATDPRLTSYSKFISSDYMLSALGLNPQTTEKRLGDGSYEQNLVMNQVTQLTGRTFLAGYSDNMDEYTALMNNGVSYSKEFGLTPGIALTGAQMQQLTTDMVWLVSQTVTLPNGSQQTVLVPTVYLAKGDTVDLQHSGAIVAGNSVSLNATGNVNNSGHIVGDVATAVLGNNIVNSGVIGSGGTTMVAALQDVRNTSGQIGGVDTVVQAGRDVINETQTTSVSQTLHESGFTSSASSQGTVATGTISASSNAVVLAGRDVNLTGASIQTGGDATIGAGRNINAGTTTLTAKQDAGTTDGLNGGHTTTTQNVGSTITTGGNLTTVSGGDTTLIGTTVKAGGDASMIAGNNLTVTAAHDTTSYNGQSLGGSEAKHTASSYDETVQGSNVNSGNNLTLGAGQTGTAGALLSQYGVGVASDAPKGGGNLSLLGSSATTGSTQANGTTSGGATTLAATGDINVGAVSETHDSQSWEQVNRSGFLSSDKTTNQTSSHQVNSVGSTVSGDTVGAIAGHDLTIAGSTVASTNDMALAAGHNLNITTTQDTSQSSSFHEEKTSGLGGTGGAGISYGASDTKVTTHDSSVTQNGSLVGSTNGSVAMTAGDTLHITGSQVIAAQDVTGKAATVTIDAATGTSHHDETQETKTSGFTLGLAGSIGDAINGSIQQSQAISSGAGDARAKALHGIAAAGDAAMAVAGMTGGSLVKNPSVGVQLSFGTSQSKSTSSEDQTTQTGSTVKAGGTTSFTATGGGDNASAPGNGNITIAGSDVSGNNVALTAKNQVNLVNTTNTDSTRSSNSSSSSSVGVSLTTQGFGVSASMSNAHGDANSDAAMQNNTHVTAANNVSITSGGDTNIVGANVSGNHVAADVGGNLNLASVQDTTVSAAHQSSAGGGFGISQGGGNLSFSAQNGHADANYAGVNEQAGIQAGKGGFDINVKGNTDLKGAEIASTADASKNSLTTGTLSFSDIQNQSHYSAASGGFSAGAGVGVTGKATGPASVPGSGGIVPMMFLDSNGDQSATTKSAISAGAINVTNGAGQTQDVASLNRDTSNLNGTVSKTPDINNMLSAQSDTMNAAQAAGQVVAQGIGAYADGKEKQAQDAANAAKDANRPDLAAQYQAEADSWAEGGTNRVALHVGGGALVAGLGGGSIGSAAQGAAGAGVSAALAGNLNRIADTIGGTTGSMLAGNIVSNVLAGAGGALVGGTTGAFTSSNADLYNRSTGNGDGKGGTGNEFLDRFSKWSDSPLSTLGSTLTSLGDQFVALMKHDAQVKLSEPPTDLAAQGVANGLNAVVGAGGREPPTSSPGAVLVNPAAGHAVDAALGAPGYVPGTATIADGGGDGNSQQSASDGVNPPGRAQSRINLDNDGVNHLVDRHLDPTVNASQFTISQSDVLNLLQDPKTVSTPITREVQSAQGIRYIREVDVGSPIGTDKFNNGQSTSVMTVMTDKYGNLVSAFPGKLK